jgi:NAD(P)-dependent dehydrogenase (short-subunit alcohol dehydrogenase family)
MEESAAMDLGLRGRACVVTGASGGIGSATARALSCEGAAVVLVGRREEALERVAARCREAGAVEAMPIVADLTDAGEADRVIAETTGALGRIDALVNNAGTTGTRSLDELADEDWQEQWDLHVMASMRLMRAAAPQMAQAGWGRVVNVCSSSSKRPSGALDMAYSVTKAAQLSLSRAFADRFAAQGVLVNAVIPGPIEGEMWLAEDGLAEQLAAKTGQSRQAVLDQLGSRVPLGRLGTEDEVAAVITFLCSEQASNVAGAAWSVDGGSVPTIF